MLTSDNNPSASRPEILTSGCLSREQLVLVLNLTESKEKVSKIPLVLSRWLAEAPEKTVASAASVAENLNILF